MLGIQGILAAVQLERARQDQKWGEQNHPDGTGPDRRLMEMIGAPSYRSLMNDMKQIVDHKAEIGKQTWDAILLEEVFEALAEEDPEKLRTELIQVAAVAVQWVGAIDRRSDERIRQLKTLLESHAPRGPKTEEPILVNPAADEADRNVEHAKDELRKEIHIHINNPVMQDSFSDIRQAFLSGARDGLMMG